VAQIGLLRPEVLRAVSQASPDGGLALTRFDGRLGSDSGARVTFPRKPDGLERGAGRVLGLA
jgi:hypothetical protein